MTTATAGVIVIGSGGAGLTAAAAAVRAGAEVILITKGRAGAANATAYAGGGFTVSPPAGSPAAGVAGLLTPDEHLRLSLETGRFLNRRDLIEFLCFAGPDALAEIERDFGVQLDWYPRGCGVHRFGRPPLLGGLGLTAPLLTYLRSRGGRVIEGAVVTRLTQSPADGFWTVEALVPETGGDTALEFTAPSVVVATGGGGAIYGRTDNPPRMTGDGYCLLHEAGAALEDMEFVQYYPLGVAEPGLPARLLDLSVLDYIRLTDEAGADPLQGKFREWGLASGREANLLARDRVSVALGRHLAAGGRLFLHTEDLAASDCPAEWVDWIRGMFPRSFDPLARPVAVAPTQHYFCGGGRINTRGEALDAAGSAIPGLYACGETTGGVDGANRVGGNALTNTVVFGLAAGKAAAEHASAAGRLPPGFPRSSPSPKGEGAGVPAVPERPARLREALHAVTDRYLGPVRSEAGLGQALRELGDLAHRGATASRETPSDRLLYLELEFALAAAAFVARAALIRTESRGGHFREDYPAEDPSWLRPVVL